MARTARKTVAAVVVIFGDDEYGKAAALRQALAALLPPSIDRSLAFCDYDGTRGEDQGGPTLAAVLDDLNTLPFLAERRVVLVRDADRFITANRERLERYLSAPSPTGTLVLTCRSFPKNTRLFQAAGAIGGQLIECRKLVGRQLTEFVLAQAERQGKRLDSAAAARLIELVGPEPGVLAAEVEKLSLYAVDRPALTLHDVSELVEQSREEKIFAAMDAAAVGRLPLALQLWEQVLASDPSAVYKVVGGMAYMVRRWLTAQQMRAKGLPLSAIASKVMMWGREAELEALLRRLPTPRLRRLLAAIAELDAQAKLGRRSIETGVEALLIELASAA